MEEKISISLTSEQINKFYNNIKIDEQTGCHIYIGCKDKDGYGLPRIGKVHIRAHRISWVLNYGKIPDELCVLHKCDNPSCVNPEHLFLGNTQINGQDMANKGRSLYGERNSGAKLNEYQVKNILNIVKENGHYRSLATELSKIYNVDGHTIRSIINRKTWKYLSI
jgi:hypothetical protein